MPITLNKKKDFRKKTDSVSTKVRKKAQDETIQITRGEWESMQESLSQLQSFMNDLVEGNLEIEIIDEGAEEEAPADVEEEMIEVEGEPEEEMTEEDGDEEEVEGEDGYGKDGSHMHDKEHKKMHPAMKNKKEDKMEDADLDEVMKDPEKRKAVLEYLKATDANFNEADMTYIRRKVNNFLRKDGLEVAKTKAGDSFTRHEVLNRIMADVKNHKKAGKALDANIITDTALDVLGDLEYVKEEKEADEATKKVVKRKTIKKSVDAAIPDFTSRFEDPITSTVKAVDNSIEEEDLSQKFSNRFN